MFELLAHLDDATLSKVLYHVGQRMYERRVFDDRETRQERMLDAFGPDLDQQLVGTVEAVIGEIEAREGVPLSELSDQETGRYYHELDEMYWRRVRSRPDFNPERGQRLLNELRREFGMAA